MHLELLPAVPRPTPGAELTVLTAKIAVAVVVNTTILAVLGSMFWLGVRISVGLT